MSDIFKIQDIPKWQGLEWSVRWHDYGLVQRETALSTIWNQAFKTGAPVVGFANSTEAMSINADVYYRYSKFDDIVYMLKPVLPISGVAFPELCYAEKFVDELNKLIEWNMLKRDYD